MKTFDRFLATLNVLSSPTLALLSSPRLATFVHRGGLEGLDRAYQTIFDAVQDKTNRFEFASTLLTRAPDEIATLLGINDMYE
jgi:conserved oligomeric Golgi complex subunit 6